MKFYTPPNQSIVDQVMPLLKADPTSLPLNVMNIINAKMSTGKTFSVANSFVPELIKQGVQLFVISFPLTEIPDMDEFMNARRRLESIFDVVDAVGTSKEQLNTLFEDIEEHGSPCNPTIILTTHQYMYVTAKKRFARYLSMVGYDKCAIFVDEAHTWLTSCSQNYEIDKGSKIGHYAASAYIFNEEFAQSSPYLFGLTATASAELLHQCDNFKLTEDYVDLQPRGTLKFDVVANAQEKSSLTGFVSPYKELSTFDALNEDTVRALLETQLEEIYWKRHVTGLKRSMVVWAANSNATDEQWRTDRTLSIFQELMMKNAHKDYWPQEGKGAIVEMTCDGNREYSRSTLSPIRNLKSSADAKKLIADDKELPAILLVKQKAKVGMSINNLSCGVMLRTSTRKFRNPQKGFKMSFVSGVSEQQIGRLMRLLLNKNVLKFNKDKGVFGYLNYFMQPNLSYKDRADLLDDLSFKFFAPDNVMWNKAFDEIREQYNSVEEDERNLRLLESDVLTCPECGYTFGEEQSVQPVLRVV
jgi:hypothetical protein